MGCERSERQDHDVATLLLVIRSNSNIRLHAKAQATPPPPSPTAAGEGADAADHGPMTLKLVPLRLAWLESKQAVDSQRLRLICCITHCTEIAAPIAAPDCRSTSSSRNSFTASVLPRRVGSNADSCPTCAVQVPSSPKTSDQAQCVSEQVIAIHNRLSGRSAKGNASH